MKQEVNVTMYPQYNNNKIKYSKNFYILKQQKNETGIIAVNYKLESE
jgi:hypothetical protein